MNPKITFLSLLWVILLSINGLCLANQTDTIQAKFKYNKVISITAIGPTGFYSLAQAKIIKEGKRGVLIRQINFNYRPYQRTNSGFFSSYTDQYKEFNGSFSLIKQFGSNNHHINLGVGQTISYERVKYSNGFKDHSIDGYAFAIVGYSYWNPLKRFYFDFSFYPCYGHGKTINFFPFPGITLGYSYGKGLVVPFLKNHYNPDKIISKLSIGVESNIGYSKFEFNPFGTSKGFTMSNNVVINYYPSRWYFKAQIGNSMYFNNAYLGRIGGGSASNLKVTTRQLGNKPLYLNFGAGLGYQFVSISKWQLSAEALIGTFFMNNLPVNAKSTVQGIALTDNINYSLSVPIDRKWFTSMGIRGKRKLTERLDLDIGIVYKLSEIRPLNNYYSVKIKDYLLSLNLNYKIK